MMILKKLNWSENAWESGTCEFFSKHGWLCELKKNEKKIVAE
jgi:hypothetical protein